MKCFVINSGSSSIKYQVIEMTTEAVLATGLVERIGENFYRVKIFFGFMEDADVPAALQLCDEQGLTIDPSEVSYFLSRETLMPTPGEGMPLWRERLFEFMFRNATSAANFFHLPFNRVIEMGSQIAI